VARSKKTLALGMTVNVGGIKNRRDIVRITPTSPEFQKALILLDGRLVKTAMAADDVEGWVDVPDITAMAPVDLANPLGWDPDSDKVTEWEEVKLKRRYGKIEIKIL
jgi:hypothetical protein